MLKFRILRRHGQQAASGLDMGDLEFTFGDHTVSSEGQSRLLNMVYLSAVDLIDGLLGMEAGGKAHEFVGVDSSFIVRFEKVSRGVKVVHQRSDVGTFPLDGLLKAIDEGLDHFLSDPLNRLPVSDACFPDFDESRQALKRSL